METSGVVQGKKEKKKIYNKQTNKQLLPTSTRLITLMRVRCHTTANIATAWQACSCLALEGRVQVRKRASLGQAAAPSSCSQFGRHIGPRLCGTHQWVATPVLGNTVT